MVEIYLCRHGQSEANAAGIIAGHVDSPLNDIGRAQAQEIGELAQKAGLKFDYVYTSPLSRARETAQIIADVTSSPSPKVMNDLIERDFGILSGKHHKFIPTYATELLETNKLLYFMDGEGVETFDAAMTRAQKVLDEIRQKHTHGNILLVSHGDFGMALFAAFHKQPIREALKHFHFGNSEMLHLHEDSHHRPHVFEIDQRGVVDKA